MTTTTQSQRSFTRFGAGLAIVGAILAGIGNGLHPHLTDPTLEAFLSLIAARADWTLVHFIIIIAILCITGGLFGVLRSIEHEAGADWARLGFAAAVLGNTVSAVNMTSDGFAMKAIAESWASAAPAQQAALLPAAEVLHQVNFSFYTAWIFLFLGFPFVLYGLALMRSDIYPRWVGWLGLIAGAGSTVVGTMQFVGGETELLTTLFLVFSVAITIWVFIVGILLWRTTVPVMAAKLAEVRAS